MHYCSFGITRTETERFQWCLSFLLSVVSAGALFKVSAKCRNINVSENVSDIPGIGHTKVIIVGYGFDLPRHETN